MGSFEKVFPQDRLGKRGPLRNSGERQSDPEEEDRTTVSLDLRHALFSYSV